MKAHKRSSRDIRSESRLDVLHALLSLETSTRNELSRRTRLSVATVATIVNELLAEDLLIEAGLSSSGAGRPTTVLRINGDRGYVIGVDIAETYVRSVVFDAALIEVGSAEVPLDESLLSLDYLVEGTVASLTRALAETGVDRSAVLGAGIALPGLVRGGESMDVVAPARQWRNREVIDRLREQIGLPLVVENSLKAIATAELWFGKGRTASSMVIVNLGTGVGAGIFIDGKILRGSSNSAGEWGHTILVLDGRLCRCGRRGCVEAYVGAPAIQETLREIAPEHPLTQAHQRDFIDALAAELATGDQDAAVRETLARTAHYLGCALADIAAMINPELLMITGWTAWALGELLLPDIEREMIARAPAGSADDLELGISTVRGNSVAIGMATLAFERFLGDVGLPTTAAPLAI